MRWRKDDEGEIEAEWDVRWCLGKEGRMRDLGVRGNRHDDPTSMIMNELQREQ